MDKFSSILIGSVFALSATAGELSTAAEAEARAMLEQVIAALKSDEVKAIEALNSGYGVGPFRVRERYVLCATADGKFTAHPKLVEINLKGQNLKDQRDANGKEIGKEVIARAKEGKITSFSYMYERLGSDRPQPKEALVTKVGNQHCGIAYYKQP